MTKRLAVSKPIDQAASAIATERNTRAVGDDVAGPLFFAGILIRQQEWVWAMAVMADEESDE